VPASRFFIENWVPESCGSTKSMISRRPKLAAGGERDAALV